MYPEMRRKDRAIPPETARKILEGGEYGILSTTGPDGLPSGVPLSYVLDGDAVVFHCAMTGQKITNLRCQPRASFVVVGKTQPVYDKDYTTYFESAVVQGGAAEVVDEEEKARLLRLLCEKYLPEHMDKFEGSLRSLPRTGVWRLSMESVTGKAKL